MNNKLRDLGCYTVLRAKETIIVLDAQAELDNPTPVSGDSLAIYKGWGAKQR